MSEASATMELANKFWAMVEGQQENKQGIFDLYMDIAKFQPHPLASADDRDKAKYFQLNSKKIISKFFSDLKKQYPVFDDFLIDFSLWIENVKFPIQSPKTQKKPEQRQEQTPNIPQLQVQLKQTPLSQTQTQAPIIRASNLQQQAVKSKLEKERNQQRATQGKQFEQRQLSNQKMKSQSQQKRKQLSYKQSQTPNQKNMPNSYNTQQKQPQSHSPYRYQPEQTRQTNQFVINPISQTNLRVTSKSPTNAQRYQQMDNRTTYFQRQEPKRQDLIKKILNRICDCYENPEKKMKPYNELKIQLENLRRLEDAEGNFQRGTFKNERR